LGTMLRYIDQTSAPEEEQNNISKGRILEEATRTALSELEIEFKDVSRVYNGRLVGFVPLGRELANGKIPDFLTKSAVIECKNWHLRRRYWLLLNPNG